MTVGIKYNCIDLHRSITAEFYEHYTKISSFLSIAQTYIGIQRKTSDEGYLYTVSRSLQRGNEVGSSQDDTPSIDQYGIRSETE